MRFCQTAELVLQLGKAKRAGNLDQILKDLGRADLIILDEFGYVPFDIDGARLLYQIIAGAYERRSIIFTTNIEFGKWGTIFADDKLAAAIIDRIVHHGRLIEFHGPSRRLSQALMFNNKITTRRHAPRTKPKKANDKNQNANLTKYSRSIRASYAPRGADPCTGRRPRFFGRGRGWPRWRTGP